MCGRVVVRLPPRVSPTLDVAPTAFDILLPALDFGPDNLLDPLPENLLEPAALPAPFLGFDEGR